MMDKCERALMTAPQDKLRIPTEITNSLWKGVLYNDCQSVSLVTPPKDVLNSYEWRVQTPGILCQVWYADGSKSATASGAGI